MGELSRRIINAMSRILIIDDDAAFGELLSALLSAEGHTVFSAESTHAALELFRLAFEPDLILVDLNMGRMNGFETMSVLRAHPRSWDASIVMLTGDQGEEIAGQARARGATGFLSKPINPASIGRQVARFLGDPGLVWLDDHHTVTRAA